MPRLKKISLPGRYNPEAHPIERERVGSAPAPAGYPEPSTLLSRSHGNGDEFWSIKMVSQKTGLSRASIYRYVARNLFPPRRRIGPGRIAWLASEVLAWMQSRPRPETRS